MEEQAKKKRKITKTQMRFVSEYKKKHYYTYQVNFPIECKDILYEEAKKKNLSLNRLIVVYLFKGLGLEVPEWKPTTGNYDTEFDGNE